MIDFEKYGLAVPKILFPNCDIYTWATLACDQHTSNPSYWEEVEKITKGKPSTLKLMMPEAWLGREDKLSHQENIPKEMEEYLKEGVLKELPLGMMYVKRTLENGKVRKGLLALLDLEKYEYAPGNKALCRATEGVVEERLPARIEIRKKASFEMPHAMVLYHDEKNLLMDQLEILTRNRTPLYNSPLMLGGGSIKGHLLSKDEDLEIVEKSMEVLLKEAVDKRDGMLFAVGDGNHSMAAAKKCGDRYILVEFVNIFDEGLEFFPIHRILNEKGEAVDYVHGEEETLRIAKEKGLTPKIMPNYPKERLFADVIENGVLPKKTFSMGEANDKRYYLECHALKGNVK